MNNKEKGRNRIGKTVILLKNSFSIFKSRLFTKLFK